MTVKKLRKQLAASIAMTLVATVALGSSTYAWFAINSQVTATGVNFTTQVSDNLFITTTRQELSQTAIAAENVFGTSLVDTQSAVLEPVSTIDGNSYFYADTTNVLGSGDTKTDEWITYVHGDTTTAGTYANAFSRNYGVEGAGAQGYLEYVFDLKAVNGGSSALELGLTKINLFYGQDPDSEKAVRVAVFVEKASGSGLNSGSNYAVTSGASGVTTNYTQYNADSTAAAVTISKASIFTVSGAENFTATKAVAREKDAANASDATDFALQDVTYGTPVSIKVAAGATEYYKVVARVWLEGEDKTCNNTTFAVLDGKENAWNISLDWKLGEDSAVVPAQYITSIAAAKVDLTAAGVAVSSNATDVLVINGVNYTKITGAQVDSKDIYTNDGAISKTSRIYTIEEGLRPTDVTNMVILPTE